MHEKNNFLKSVTSKTVLLWIIYFTIMCGNVKRTVRVNFHSKHFQAIAMFISDVNDEQYYNYT